MYTSAFVANWAAVARSHLHHLYEWGTASLFCVIGPPKKVVAVGQGDQRPVVKGVCSSCAGPSTSASTTGFYPARRRCASWPASSRIPRSTSGRPRPRAAGEAAAAGTACEWPRSSLAAACSGVGCPGGGGGGPPEPRTCTSPSAVDPVHRRHGRRPQPLARRQGGSSSRRRGRDSACCRVRNLVGSPSAPSCVMQISTCASTAGCRRRALQPRADAQRQRPVRQRRGVRDHFRPLPRRRGQRHREHRRQSTPTRPLVPRTAPSPR
jgi:hypothetical protein